MLFELPVELQQLIVSYLNFYEQLSFIMNLTNWKLPKKKNIQYSVPRLHYLNEKTVGWINTNEYRVHDFYKVLLVAGKNELADILKERFLKESNIHIHINVCSAAGIEFPLDLTNARSYIYASAKYAKYQLMERYFTMYSNYKDSVDLLKDLIKETCDVYYYKQYGVSLFTNNSSSMVMYDLSIASKANMEDVKKWLKFFIDRYEYLTSSTSLVDTDRLVDTIWPTHAARTRELNGKEFLLEIAVALDDMDMIKKYACVSLEVLVKALEQQRYNAATYLIKHYCPDDLTKTVSICVTYRSSYSGMRYIASMRYIAYMASLDVIIDWDSVLRECFRFRDNFDDVVYFALSKGATISTELVLYAIEHNNHKLYDDTVGRVPYSRDYIYRAVQFADMAMIKKVWDITDVEPDNFLHVAIHRGDDEIINLFLPYCTGKRRSSLGSAVHSGKANLVKAILEKSTQHMYEVLDMDEDYRDDKPSKYQRRTYRAILDFYTNAAARWIDYTEIAITGIKKNIFMLVEYALESGKVDRLRCVSLINSNMRANSRAINRLFETEVDLDTSSLFEN